MRSIRVLDRSLKPLLMLVAIAATSFFGSAATVHAADSATWINESSFKYTSGSSSATFENVGTIPSEGTDYDVFAIDGQLPSEGEGCMDTPIYGFSGKDTYLYSAGALNNTVGESGALDSCGYIFDTKHIEITGDSKDTPKVDGLNDQFIQSLYAECPDLKTDSNTKKLKGFGKKRSDAFVVVRTNIKADGSPLLEGGYDMCATLAGFLKNPKWLDGDLTKHLVASDEEEEFVETTSCAVDGIGWVVCPVLTFIGRMNDAAFTFLQNILGIQPAVVGSEATRNAWSAFRDIANVAFVIAFMVIVYSQITSAGISNYGIKKLLPRIVVAAILVNVSFYVCAIAVDISNIVGASIFTLLKDSIDVGSEIETTQWESSVGNILGIAATGIGVVLLVVALTMAPAVLLAFVLIILILIARQALIILLIVISPLAFVAYLLPNTEDWFKKWWKAFVATLMVYPIVGLVFGASTLASSILVQVSQSGDPDDDQQLLMLIALGVAAVPLFAIPAILKGSLSAAGSIGTRISGLADRSTRMAGNQFGNRSKQYAGGAANAVRRRAMSGQGVVGRKGWRSAYGLGVGGMMRGKANRNNKYKSLEERAQAAEDTYINTDPKNASRRRAAIAAQQTASIQQGINKNLALKDHMEAEVELNVKGKISELELEGVKAAQGALVKEISSGTIAGMASGAGAGISVADMERAHEAHEQIEIQGKRANSAARASQEELAKRISNDATGLAIEAAGIGDAVAVSRVKAEATAVEINAANEAIKNEKTTMTKLKSDFRPGDVRAPGEQSHMEIVQDITASDERRAAAAGMIMQSGAMEDIHKLSDIVQGMGTTDTAKNIRMQMVADKNRTPFGWGASDIAALQRGDVMTKTVTDPATGATIAVAKKYDEQANDRAKIKLSPEKWSGLDPDDQKRLKNLSIKDEASGGLSDEALQNLIDASTEAITNDNIDVTKEAKDHTAAIIAAARGRSGSTFTIPPGF